MGGGVITQHAVEATQTMLPSASMIAAPNGPPHPAAWWNGPVDGSQHRSTTPFANLIRNQNKYRDKAHRQSVVPPLFGYL